MSVKITGRCEKCGPKSEVEIECYPFVAEPGGRVMVDVVATCKECGVVLDRMWAYLSELAPDWTEYEKAREALGL